jgi:hypothetical protein
MGHSVLDADLDFNRSMRDNVDVSDTASASASHVDDMIDSENEGNDVEVSNRGSVGVLAEASSHTMHNLSFDSVSVTVGRARNEVLPSSHGFLQRLVKAAEGTESTAVVDHATVGVTVAKRAVLTQWDQHTVASDRSPSSRHSSQSSYASATESLAIPSPSEIGTFGVPPSLENTAVVSVGHAGASGPRNMQMPSESLWAAQSRKREKEKTRRGEGAASSAQHSHAYAGKEVQKTQGSGEMQRASSSNKFVETRQEQPSGVVQQYPYNTANPNISVQSQSKQQYPYNTANPNMSVQSQPKQQYPYNTGSGANLNTSVHNHPAQQIASGSVPAGMYNNNTSMHANTSQAPSRFRPLLTQGVGVGAAVRGVKSNNMPVPPDASHRNANNSDINKSTQGSDVFKVASHHEQYRSAVADTAASKGIHTSAAVPIAYSSHVKTTAVSNIPGQSVPDQARAAERIMMRQPSPEEAARSQNLAGAGITAEQQQKNRFRLSGLMFM